MRHADAEVAVVGAGVMGLATARALAQPGREVVVLEQFELGHSRGSSHGGSRIVRLSYPEERWVRLAQESYPLWRELEAECGRPLLELHGTLDLGDWEPNRDALAACGVASEVLEAGEIERRFRIGWSRRDRALPGRRRDRLRRPGARGAARSAAGGRGLRERARVDSVEEEADAVSVGGVRARAAVVTAGAVGAGARRRRCDADARDGVVLRARRSRCRRCSTRDGAAARLCADCTGRGAEGRACTRSGPRRPGRAGRPDAEIAERTAAWVARRFPRGRVRCWQETCLYTIRQNDEFLLERRGRVVVGSPCSGHGFKFAPVIGERLAALALEALSSGRGRAPRG